MAITNNYVFQTDSDIVKKAFKLDNYLIEYDHDNVSEYCVIYFSSNNIYYPNNEEVFNNEILKKNKYEWFKNRISYGYKHIFIRDIHKQWYLSGINSNINNPSKLLAFLQKETIGYKIILVGSSAGGYASVLYGQQLGAEKIFCFNGQFELNTLLLRSNEDIDPLVFRNVNTTLTKYYDINSFITNPQSINYFYSIKSKVDIEQYDHVNGLGINVIRFYTSHHGIPFLKSNLNKTLHLPQQQIQDLKRKILHPFLYSVDLIGFKKTIKSIYEQLHHKIKTKINYKSV